ncbi:hypothetical protein Tamer19_52400 [Cupriavidus sp. TA19]|nr:hypothetical protein Tamer19_52400 [Cupriavidus sp. TA19]
MTGRQHLATAANGGIVAALIGSELGATLFRVDGVSPQAEGWLAVFAGTLVISCTWQWLGTARQ